MNEQHDTNNTTNPDMSKHIVESTHGTIHDLLNDMLAKSDFPAVSQYITEINMKASPGSKTNAAELANLILKDYALTTKLLKMVNSAFYGQFSGQIVTVSRAVVILGFEQVRMAATGLIFFEHMQNRSQADEIKQAILSSFLSGILARDIADRLKAKETEEIFICSLLHNLGRLLVMYYYPEQFDRIQALVEKSDIDEDKAASEVLGSSYNDLGMQVAGSWGLPKIIISSMEALPDRELKAKKGNVDMTRALSCFSNSLYEIAGKEADLEKKQDLLRTMLKKFEHVIPMSENQISSLVDTANEKATKHSDMLGLTRQQNAMLRKMRFRDEPIAVDKEAGFSGRSAPTERPARDKPALAARETPPSRKEFFNPEKLDLDLFQIQETFEPEPSDAFNEERRLVFMNGIQEITNSLLDDDHNLDSVLTMIIETIYRGLEFSRVLICIKDPRTKMMNARFGLGRHLNELLKMFQFTIKVSSDIFNRAVNEGRDIYISDTENPAIVACLPSWYSGILRAPSFVVYPIVINKNCIGLIYADMKGGEGTVTPEKLHHLKTLRNQVVLAIKQKQ